MTSNEWKVMWMQCDKCNAINELEENEYYKCNAISAMTQMQCDEVNKINAI